MEDDDWARRRQIIINLRLLVPTLVVSITPPLVLEPSPLHRSYHHRDRVQFETCFQRNAGRLATGEPPRRNGERGLHYSFETKAPAGL